jgi:hypothetical protein
MFWSAYGGAGDSLNTAFYFNTSDVLVMSGATVDWRISTQVFRDPSAWYHIVLAIDTTQATASDRIKLYVNGQQITSFSTTNNPTQNLDLAFNGTMAHYISGSPAAGGFFFNGYMTEVNFIDGQALTPSSFGAFDAQTGVWGPIRYAGSYGTNGFYLNFSNNSNTTAATLGADYSGNGNNWTPNNFSVSAGAGNDSLVDVPTNWGVDTGVGGTVRGNYSTMNPLDTGALNSTLSDGNLKVVTEIGNFRYMGNTIWTSAGKFYAEFKITADSGYAQVGIAVRATTTNKILGQDSDSWSYNGWNGSSGNNNSYPAYGSAFGTGDTIGIAVDRDTNKLYFSKNGVWQNSGDPAAGTGSLNISGISGIPAMIAVCDNDNAGSCTFEVNFGQRPFAYTAPSGFRALNTQNLPNPTIGATPATQAGKFFNPVLYTGNGFPTSGTQSVSGVGFQPDWVWIKSRSAAGSHTLTDVIRGINSQLLTNTTGAQETNTDNITALNSDGFSLGSNTTGSTSVNVNGQTYVAWNWKANGTGVTNTAGSITSTVSANTTSGFSVVTWTGNGSNASIGHGLGAVPRMVIQKFRSATSNWSVYTATTGAGSRLKLNSTDAVVADGSFPTTPTSSLFYVNSGSNDNGVTMLAYCFAEVPGYSRFGSYTGNGSADGPFVFCGFRPAYVLFKNTSATGDWMIWDDTRSPTNVVDDLLYASLSIAEQVYTGLDFTANGFKIRNTSGDFNTNGASYIFAAFAEFPQKFSLAR